MEFDLLKELEQQSKEIAKAVTSPVEKENQSQQENKEVKNVIKEGIKKNKETSNINQKEIDKQKESLKRKPPKYDEPTAIKRHSNKLRELISKNDWKKVKIEELHETAPFYYEEIKDDEGNLLEYRMYLRKGHSYITRLSNKYYNTIINTKQIFNGILDELEVVFSTPARAVLIKLPNNYYLFDVVDGNGPILISKYENDQFVDVKRFNHTLSYLEKLRKHLKEIYKKSD